MKEHSMKISDYIEFKKPKYVYLKLIPSTSLRNYNSDKLLTLIASLYKSMNKQIKQINNKLFFECNAKISYYIYMENNKVEFYFIVPEPHLNLYKDKIIDVWQNKITINKVNEIPLFENDYTTYYLTYKKEDALSLSCDKRNNTLLNSLLTTIHVMEEGDRIGVFYNFAPTYQKNWRVKYDKTIEKLKEDLPVTKNKMSLLYLGCSLLLCISKCFDFILDSIIPSKETLNKKVKDLYLSEDTRKKRDSIVVDTQLLCFSQSKDPFREQNNAISVCQSFECLDADNSIVSKKCNSNKLDILDTKIKGAQTFKIQPREGQNFISLPARELLEEHKIIEHTNVLETEVPEKLQSGYISLGTSIYKGSETEAFHRDKYDEGNFPLVLVGEQGSGKTTYISNYVKDILKRDDGCIVIDFIKNCELSESIKKVVPKDKLLELDLSDIHNAQGIGYNELIPKKNDYLDMLDIANRKALFIQLLIDALNCDGDPLSSSMDRYLSAASNIVFLDNNASLKDIVKCLNDYNYRNKCINNIPIRLRSYLDEEISALMELDDKDKNGEICGTKMSKVDGVNHRINLLRKDLRLKMMFNRNCSENINLVKAMDEGKIILVKMQQEYFATSYSKNVIVTYLFTKIWVATLLRGSKEKQPKRFHVIVDEVFQAKTAMKLLKSNEMLPQTRKFGLRIVFSCQYLGQIEVINQTIRSAGASYMLMKGSGKANFDEFKDELAPYTLEDLEALPQYHSLNLINYEDGRVKFITKLPKPF